MKHNAHARQLRKGRYSESGRVYSITTVCRNRTHHFANLYRGRCAVRALMALSPSATTLYFVVMPDHLHWLMQLQEGADLSSTVQKMKSFTTKKLNQLSGAKAGAIWQDGFHDRALRREDDIVAIARYMVANPLRAGLVSTIREYPLWDAIWL